MGIFLSKVYNAINFSAPTRVLLLGLDAAQTQPTTRPARACQQRPERRVRAPVPSHAHE